MSDFYGDYMYDLAKELFPICRSITGNGVRKTLKILQRECADLKIYEVPSGTQVFDWTVPKEWNIKDAWVKDSSGKKIIDFAETNLHVMGYSVPVHKKVTLVELCEFLYTEPEQPEVIPYVTSYYKERFGFCVSENQKEQMLATYKNDDEFEICIDSSLEDGFLSYGEIFIPVAEKYTGGGYIENKNTECENPEIFFSTYVCHPSLANNEISGPCLAICLANWVKKMTVRKYNYRFVFIPETIGSITYLSKNYKELQKNVVAGFNLTCVGDDRTYSYLSSAYENTLADRVLKNVLSFHYPQYKKYPFLKSGSDERRYNAPGIDLPVCCFCRSLYGEYPEYHTSADNLSFISAAGLQGSFEVMSKCIVALENNSKYKTSTLCEPQLGRRGLYSTVSRKGQDDSFFLNFLAYANGKNDLIEISNIIKKPIDAVLPTLQKLIDAGLIIKDSKVEVVE